MLGRDAATQTWCVVGSINDADIVPGYRVYASTLDTNAYCCRAHGLYNVSANTCVAKTCDTNHPHVYTSFLHINHVVGQALRDLEEPPVELARADGVEAVRVRDERADLARAHGKS